MEQIGRYQITGELGRGAMGVVYRAEDPKIGRTVAIKTIRLGEMTDPKERDRLRQRLMREARSAGILSHPGIVTIYDVIEEGDTAYVFMEFVDGKTLEDILSHDATLDRAHILEILRLTAEALDYAHSKGIVHRDIKPANVMVTVDGQAKITDFGVAKIVSQQMTQAGTIMGTPNYMSPEQIQGESVDGRSDQFSLAVIAYEMLTGEKPYVAESLPTLLYKIVREPVVSPRRLNPTLSEDVDMVLETAFAKGVADRYRTCTEFVSALTMAVNTNPDWQPQRPGSVSDMETVMSQSEAPLPTLQESADSAAVVSVPESDVPPEPAQSVAERRREREEDAEKESSFVRNILLLAAAALVVAAGVWGVRHFSEEGPAPMGQPEVADAGEPTPPTTTATPAPPPSVADLGLPAPSTETASGTATDAPQSPSTEGITTPEPVSAAAESPPPDPPKPAVAKAKPKPAPAKPSEHWVQIRTDPPGATVTADNDDELVCRAPCELPLTQGRHTLRFTMAGHRLTPRTIRVPDITDVTVNLDRESGTLAITSSPPGATIELNGERRREKTPAMLKLPAGHYKIRLTMQGREPIEREVEVQDQVITNLGIDW